MSSVVNGVSSHYLHELSGAFLYSAGSILDNWVLELLLWNYLQRRKVRADCSSAEMQGKEKKLVPTNSVKFKLVLASLVKCKSVTFIQMVLILRNIRDEYRNKY